MIKHPVKSWLKIIYKTLITEDDNNGPGLIRDMQFVGCHRLDVWRQLIQTSKRDKSALELYAFVPTVIDNGHD